MTAKSKSYAITHDGKYVCDAVYDTDGCVESVALDEEDSLRFLQTFDDVDIISIVTYLLTEHESSSDRITIVEVSRIAELDRQLDDMKSL